MKKSLCTILLIALTSNSYGQKSNSQDSVSQKYCSPEGDQYSVAIDSKSISITMKTDTQIEKIRRQSTSQGSDTALNSAIGETAASFISIVTGQAEDENYFILAKGLSGNEYFVAFVGMGKLLNLGSTQLCKN